MSPGSSGISIIIVGLGFAGLACAIESVIKGHSVIVLEKYDHARMHGVINFNTNVGRFFIRWGLHDKLWAIGGHPTEFKLHNHLGEVIENQHLPHEQYNSRSYNGHRGEYFQVLFEHAHSLGVDMRMGKNVQEFWEDDKAGKAGVVVDGERLEADVVVGADGVRSTARKLVLGYDDKPKPSGYAIFRAWFDPKEAGMAEDPLTADFAGEEDIFYGWIGPDVHMLASNSKKGNAMVCVLTHKDDAEIEESWSFPGKREDALAVVKGWDPRCTAILSKVPSFVDWKLVYREPLPTWLSKGAHCALIGDAAHPILPTSIQGASQAIEDGITLAVVLQLSGKKNIPTALRAWEHIRYQRVRRTQILGETTRNKWHRASPTESGESLDLPFPEWLLDFDAERHAYEVYQGIAARIEREGYTLPELPA
ncbi:monooxygenase [Amylostereum chailletii]|nr:monooxygenase [Amylostereum chailletii]